jgi:superkiller protein 3
MNINSMNEENGSTNEEQGQEGKNENTPIEGEEKLDVNFTNEEHHTLEEKNEKNSEEAKRSRTIRTIVIILLLLLPPAYFFYKTTSNPTPTPAAEQPANQEINIAAYESATTTNPSFSNLLNLSNAYISKGLAIKSIEPLKKAIAMEPKSAAAYSNLGLAYTILGAYKEGIEACEKAVQLDSTFQLAKNNLNWALSEQKKVLDGVRQLEQKPQNERDLTFYNSLGLLYLKLENFDKGIELFNKVLAMDSKNSAALINIGTAFMSKFQYDDAIKSFQKAIDVNPNDQLSKNNLAWAMDEKKKAEASIKK